MAEKAKKLDEQDDTGDKQHEHDNDEPVASKRAKDREKK